jgi:hypothetical protein
VSQLVLTGYDGREFKLNVVQFRSPMSSQITSVQTHTMLQHFPIRCGQPDIQFTVQFPNLDLKHRFQNFVREHQVKALEVTENYGGHVTLFWPQRNIVGYTGFITNFKVIERRFEYAPMVTFGVDLVDSLMSTRTQVSSTAPGFPAVYGPQIPPWSDFEDNILKPALRAVANVAAPWWTDFSRFGPATPPEGG